MFLALATTAAAVVGTLPLPTLCGVYDDRTEADAYVKWENDRADFSVYYVAEGEALTRALTPHDLLATIILHEADGEWHWSAEGDDGTVYAYGTDFHPTRAQALNDADTQLAVLADMREHRTH